MKKLIQLFMFSLAFIPLIAAADDPCQYDGGEGGVDAAINACTTEIQAGRRSGDSLAYALTTRAELWIMKKEYDKASVDTTEALRLSKEINTQNHALVTHAISLQGLKEYELAIAEYSSLLVGFPDAVAFHAMRGSAYGAMGELDKSIEDSTQAIDLATNQFTPRGGSDQKVDSDFNPKWARALYNRGLAWKLKGKYDKAIEDYNKAVRSNPGDPHAWMARPSDWGYKEPAEQAEILYKDIDFSPEMNTSDRRIFNEILDVKRTRYGDVILVQTDILPAATVMFNGQVVYSDPGMYVGLHGYAQSKDSDVVLIGSNPGGSATPDTNMFILVINPDGMTYVISDPDFVADTPGRDDKKITTDATGRVFVSFAYRSGNEMVAELDSGRVVIHAYPRDGQSLSDDDCRWLYDYGSKECSSEITRNNGCAKSVANAEIYGCLADMGSFRYISNRSGYVQGGFNEACLAWCEKKEVDYEHFKKVTCSIKN